MYSRVLALVDSTALRFKIAERAIGIASGSHAVLRIGHVADATPYFEAGLDLSSISETLQGDLERDFEGLVRKALEDSLVSKIDVTVATGYMPHTLHQQLIDPFQPDLIVCGTRELSDLKYLISGSFSTHLIRNVKCDVLVIKEDCD